jgi:phospholipid transport system substrate-binding protein
MSPGVRRWLAGLLVLGAMGAGAEEVALPSATTQVAGFHEQLTEVASAELDGQQRRAQLAPIVPALFDLPLICRLSIGRRWRELEPGQQAELSAALGQVVIATYADRFAGPMNARFEILEEVAGRRGPVVRARIVRHDGTSVPLDYHFREGKIYNVVADGVSDLSLRRADYSDILKREGFEALLGHLAAQRVRLENENDDAEN